MVVSNLSDGNNIPSEFDELAGEIWQYLFNPNTGLLQNTRNAINNSQSAVTSAISYNSNNLSSQLTSNTNSVKSQITSSASQLASQVSYIQNAIQSQISSTTNALRDNVNQTEADIQKNIDDESVSTRQLSQNLTNTINANIDSSIADLNSSLGDSISASTSSINTGIAALDDLLRQVEASITQGISDTLANIRTAIENLFAPFITFIQTLIKLFEQWFKNNVTDKISDFFDGTDTLRDLHFDIFKGRFPNNPDVLTDLGIVGSHGGITSKLLLTILSIPTLISLLNKVTEPSWRNFVYNQEAEFTSRALDPDILVANFFKDNVALPELLDALNHLGFSNSNSALMIEAARRIPDITSLRDGFLRKLISKDTVENKLNAYGFSKNDSNLIVGLFDVIPPLSDIITMAVREVFSPQIVQKFGQKEGYPSLLTEYAAKQGLSQEWAENYWAAHWDLPSTIQGFEMLHRSVITQDELELLLRAKDVMPFWRDKLTQISYNPLTRVDVRRMYRVGVLNRDQVKQAYREIGYNNDNAEKLTEFTIRYEIPEATDESSDIRALTKSVILKAYERQTITHTQALQRLIELGYQPNDALLLLQLKDYEIETIKYPDRSKEFNERMGDVILAAYRKGTISYTDALSRLKSVGYRDNDATIALTFSDLEYQVNIKSSIVNAVKQMFVEGVSSITEVTNLLNSYRFSSDEIRKVLEELNIVKNLRSRKPTQAQFEKAYKGTVINESQYRQELRDLGYAEKYLDLLVSIAQ